MRGLQCLGPSLSALASPHSRLGVVRRIAGEKGTGKTGKPLHFKGSTFHRVIKSFMCQVRAPLGTLGRVDLQQQAMGREQLPLAWVGVGQEAGVREQ